ncbi:penicillin acylase family protein [Microbispora sp. H10949]|uniref:penicillin acylase family protein n=1 Tax=Microbispora sp. H10949 TaxID=2729111 RepID=UPI001C726ABF|nr:penicillin acylase family protein [Microbispora sp. H10949]
MSVRIYRDRWGIPHLRAGDARELAYAQGFVTAVDRAWQLEVERLRGAGTSAAVLGADAVPWDRFVRQVRLDDTARRCLRALDADTAAWVGAYVDGVNAGLPEGARRAPEFRAAGQAGNAAGHDETEPAGDDGAAGDGAAALVPGRWEPWTPLAVWLSHHVLFAHVPAKLWREAVTARLGAETVALFATDGPGTSGSNGWLVPGDRTRTGAPIIAGDPHRIIEDPGFYQQIRLACPEFDVAGLAVPGVPGIAHFGHAGTVAWAITNAMADYQDLFRERLRRRDGRVEALGPAGWRPATAHTEVVEVAGGEPVEVEVIETERGPVVMGEPPRPYGPARQETKGRAPRDRDTGREGGSPTGHAGEWEDGPDSGQDAAQDPGREGEPDAGREDERAGEWEGVSLRYPPRVFHDLGFATLPALLRARTVADVDRAFDRWVEPVNVVLAADTGGGLLHRVAGLVPVRHPGNSQRVVPAWEPGHEWRGRHAPMPRREVTGITVMANERGISAPFGVEFAPPYRADRIRALLEAAPVWSAGDMAAIHTDTLLPGARPLLGLLAGLTGLGPGAVRLRDRLTGWDRRMDADSVAAAAYADVRAEVVRRLAAHPALAPLADLSHPLQPEQAHSPDTSTPVEARPAQAGAAKARPMPTARPTQAGGGPPVDGDREAPGEGVACPEVFRPWLVAAPRIAHALETLLTTDRLPGLGTDDLAEIARAALEDVAARGETGVRWGDLHRLVPWRALPAPAATPSDPSGAAQAEPGVSGDHGCVLCTSSVPGVTHHCARGPAARYVWDLARRDASLWVVPFGASGVPGDPHHRDQQPLWVRGELVPLVTDWTLLTEERHDL